MTEPASQAAGAAPPFAVCTIIWKNYLAYARTLAQSLRALHPDVPIVVLLADRVDGYFDPAGENFEVIEIDALEIPQLRQFCFKYSPFLLNTAVKPWLLGQLLARPGWQKVLYLDADVLVLDHLDGLAALLDRFAILLTPHLTAPSSDPYTVASVERAMLLFGAYNLGFIGLARGPVTDRFLAWWRDRLWRDCVIDPPNGLFVDQRWIDLVPGMFDGVHVVRDPSYNAARWNLHCAALTLRGGRVLLDGSPCRFFHFSGFDPRHGEVVKHNRFYTYERLGEAAELYRRYGDLLLRNGFAESIAWPQAFSVFDNGVLIPDSLRMRYLQLGDAAAQYGDPFASAPPGSLYRAWYRQHSGLRGGATALRRAAANAVKRTYRRLSRG